MNLRTLTAPRAHSAASLCCGSILISLATTFVASAQTTTPAAAPATSQATTPAKTATTVADSTYQATIVVDEALVRSDASTESGYPFGTLVRGQVVTVIDDKNAGWVRVRTDGPAFEGWGGFVTQLPSVKLSADGKSLTVTGTAAISAPNGPEGYAPERSWKAIGFLTTNDTVPVLETIKGERETYYAVPLSAKTSGWIVSTAISRNGAPATTNPAETGKSAGSGTKAAEKPTAETTNTETTEKVKVAEETAPEPKTVKKPKPPAEPKPPSAAMKLLDEYKALEQKWNSMAKDTCARADLQELQTSYSNLSRNTDAVRATRQAAMVRSIQITQLIELRDMQDAAKKIAARGEDKAREVQAIEEWLRARQQYTAVGVLNASVVYDGERLPRLYRLQDPTSGLTVAYLTEDPDLKLSSMLGLVVGVKGDKKFDEGLRRDIITPSSMTVLRSEKETAISSPEKVGGAGSGDDSGK